MFNPGDPVTRTTSAGQVETVFLPPIDMNHLEQLGVAGGSIQGLHILPTGLLVSSTSPVLLPTGTITILDSHGTPLTGAQVRLTPRKVPRSPDDTLEAKVEVLTGGVVIGSISQKTFFPQSWTPDQIQQAIYTAFVACYRANGTLLGKVFGTTAQGVLLEFRVRGTISRTKTRLTSIGTAFPLSGQNLDASHLP